MDLLKLICGVGTIVATGWWILVPIDRRGKARNAPVQYSIGDFLCLFVIMQLPLIVTHFMPRKFVDDNERTWVWIFTVATWIMAPLIWFSCARALSKAAIGKGLHRFVFLAMVVPFVYFMLIPFQFITTACIEWIANKGHRGPDDPTSNIFIAWFSLACAFVLCGLFTRWIVRQSCEAVPLD